MTAEKLFDKEFKASASILLAYRKEIIDMMIEFATIKCKEQKKICFEEATHDDCYDSISYSPLPKM